MSRYSNEGGYANGRGGSGYRNLGGSQNGFRGENQRGASNSPLPPKPSSSSASTRNPGASAANSIPVGSGISDASSRSGGRGRGGADDGYDQKERPSYSSQSSRHNSDSTQRPSYNGLSRNSFDQNTDSGWGSRAGRNSTSSLSNHYPSSALDSPKDEQPSRDGSSRSKGNPYNGSSLSSRDRVDGAGSSSQPPYSSNVPSSSSSKPTREPPRGQQYDNNKSYQSKSSYPSSSVSSSYSRGNGDSRYQSKADDQGRSGNSSYSRDERPSSSAYPSSRNGNSTLNQIHSPRDGSDRVGKSPVVEKRRSLSPVKRARGASLERDDEERARSRTRSRSAYSSRSGSYSSSRSRSRSSSRSGRSRSASPGEGEADPQALFASALSGVGISAASYPTPSSSNRNVKLDFSKWNNAASRSYSSLLKTFASLDSAGMGIDSIKKIADFLAKCCNLDSPVEDDKKEETVNCLYDLCEGESELVRAIGYDSLCTLSQAAPTLAQRNVDVLVQLLSISSPEEQGSISETLSWHLSTFPSAAISVLIADHCLSDLRPLVLEWITKQAGAALGKSVFGNAEKEKELIRGLKKVLKTLDIQAIEENKEIGSGRADRTKIWNLLRKCKSIWTTGNDRLVPSLLDCLVKTIITFSNPELHPETLEQMKAGLEADAEAEASEENLDMKLTIEQSRTLPNLSSALRYLLENGEQFDDKINLSRIFLSTQLTLWTNSDLTRGKVLEQPSIKLLSIQLQRALAQTITNLALAEFKEEDGKKETFSRNLLDAIKAILHSQPSNLGSVDQILLEALLIGFLTGIPIKVLDLEGDRSLSVSFLKSDNPQLQTIRNIARSNPDKSLYSGSKLQKMQVMAAKNLSQFDLFTYRPILQAYHRRSLPTPSWKSLEKASASTSELVPSKGASQPRPPALQKDVDSQSLSLSARLGPARASSPSTSSTSKRVAEAQPELDSNRLQPPNKKPRANQEGDLVNRSDPTNSASSSQETGTGNVEDLEGRRKISILGASGGARGLKNGSSPAAIAVAPSPPPTSSPPVSSPGSGGSRIRVRGGNYASSAFAKAQVDSVKQFSSKGTSFSIAGIASNATPTASTSIPSSSNSTSARTPTENLSFFSARQNASKPTPSEPVAPSNSSASSNAPPAQPQGLSQRFGSQFSHQNAQAPHPISTRFANSKPSSPSIQSPNNDLLSRLGAPSPTTPSTPTGMNNQAQQQPQPEGTASTTAKDLPPHQQPRPQSQSFDIRGRGRGRIFRGGGYRGRGGRY